MKMSSQFNFTVTSWSLGNVRVKPYSNTQTHTKNRQITEGSAGLFSSPESSSLMSLDSSLSSSGLNSNLRVFGLVVRQFCKNGCLLEFPRLLWPFSLVRGLTGIENNCLALALLLLFTAFWLFFRLCGIRTGGVRDLVQRPRLPPFILSTGSSLKNLKKI